MLFPTTSQSELCSDAADDAAYEIHGESIIDCSTSCTPLSYSCDNPEKIIITYSPHILCNGEDDSEGICQCDVFYAGEDCHTHFIDIRATAATAYSSIFMLGFLFLWLFCAREIYRHLMELDESAKKSVAAAAARGQEGIRRRSSSVQFNRPKSMGKTTFVNGFFQPKRVRFLVIACCFMGSFLRFIYLFNITFRICYEGTICSALVFEPANIFLICAALLTVMFWKKMGMMFKKGINRANQYEDDVRFFQIFGFYVVFQFTMIIVQSAAAAIGVDVSSLYDISLIVSAVYISLLLIGSVKFGMTLLRLLRGPKNANGGAPSADAKAKTWKKVRKVVMMLAFTVPGSSLYMIALACYLIGGMRGQVETWLPMQGVFRFLECMIIWGLCSCLVHRKPGSGDKKNNSSTHSTSQSFRRNLSGLGGGKGKKEKERGITVIEESMQENAIDEGTIETHMV